MDEERKSAQLAQARLLQGLTFQPHLDMPGNVLTYGGTARADFPLGKNATLGVSAGGQAGRGFGQARDVRLPFAPRAGVELRYEF